MIAYLRGLLLEKQQDTLVIDVQGVGYEVYTNPRVSSALGSVGAEISLVIYTDVRETAITLYGFNSAIERQTFLLLKKVKGIGSKLAMGILSSVKPEDLLVAIGREDTAVLVRVPGVGKKSAERIIVELREQVREFALSLRSDYIESQAGVFASDKSNTQKGAVSSLAAENVEMGLGSTVQDARLALEKLGFSNDRADKAVKLALEACAGNKKLLDAGELVKMSLSYF